MNLYLRKLPITTNNYVKLEVAKENVQLIEFFICSPNYRRKSFFERREISNKKIYWNKVLLNLKNDINKSEQTCFHFGGIDSGNL